MIPERRRPMHEGWSYKGGVFSPLPLKGPAGLKVGFTTREAGDFSEPHGPEMLCEALGVSRLRMLHQVHGVEILDPEAEGDKPEADGWAGSFTDGVLLAVKAADCLPVLIWSEEESLGAAVHAGWRGAVAGIAGLAVKKLGADPSTLSAALGPCICQSCFEVGPEVAKAAGMDTRWTRKGKPGKYHLDLAELAAADLEGAGIRSAAILRLGLCTRCRPDLFWSFRGDGGKKRMVGFVGIAP